jgi:hypothetical protein
MIDSKPIQPSYLSLKPLNNFGRNDAQQSRQTKPNPNGSLNQAHINWGQMLNDDLEDLHKDKIDRHIEDFQEKVSDEINRRKRLTAEFKQAMDLKDINASSNIIKDFKSSGLNKIQEMLLQKIIAFQSLDENTQQIKQKLYKFLFVWKDNENGNTSNRMKDPDSKTGRSQMLDEAEEKKKRL